LRRLQIEILGIPKNSILKRIALLIILLIPLCSQSQNTTNRGKDFWIGYMDHRDGTGSRMVLYITSDSSTTGTVSVPGANWSKTFSVTANSMTLVDVPPTSAMVLCTDCIENKGINITAAKDIIIYSHVYHSARSDATLILPTKASGKEFYCMSNIQRSSNEYSQFMIVASQDKTLVKITPTSDIKRNSGVRAKGTSYTITLNKGEVYQGQGTRNGNSINADITGTHIEVIDTGKNANCRTVAVFSGSSFTALGCNGSGDNLFQQMFPVEALGKTFVIVPFKSRSGDLLRFLGTEDKTVVKVNGTNYFVDKAEFKEISVPSSGPLYITASKPILVGQFQKTQSCGGGIGDPSMTILPPIEQTLNDIVLYSSSLQNITANYINIVIPTSGRSSFRLDGKSISWSTVPSNTNYSYAQETVSAGNHRLKANIGFSAVAYGFGIVESYGYVAGANVKKRNIAIDISNSTYKKYNGVCFGLPVEFKAEGDISLYKSFKWDFGDSTTDTSTSIKHTYKKPGKYIAKLIAYKENNSSCGLSYDSSIFQIEIFHKPKALFSLDGNCINKEIEFIDSSNIDTPSAIQTHIWDLGDGNFKLDSIFDYQYKDTGKYLIQEIIVSNKECRDTFKDSVYINSAPENKLIWDKLCYKNSTQFVDSSTILKGNNIKWEWIFNEKDTIKMQDPEYHFKKEGLNNILYFVESDSGCRTRLDTNLFVFEEFNPDFHVPNGCSSAPFSFVNLSKGKKRPLKYIWNFGDGNNSTSTNPMHSYDLHGSFSITLTVTQDGVCKDSITKYLEVFPGPISDFKYTDTCFNETTKFTSFYTLSQGHITKTLWTINGKAISPDSIISYKFTSEGRNNIQLEHTSNNNCVSNVFKTINIAALPKPIIGPKELQDVCKTQNFTLYDSTPTSEKVIWQEWTFNNIKSFGNSTDHFADTTGILAFKLTTKNEAGCIDSIEKRIIVSPLPYVSFDTGFYCAGEVFQPINNSLVTEGSIVKWNWIHNGNTISTKKNPELSISTEGIQEIKLIAQSNRLCIDSLSKEFVFYPSPVVSFDVDTVCLGTETTFTNKNTITNGFIASNTWYTGNGYTYDSKSIRHKYNGSGDYTVSLEAISDKGCKSNRTKSVHVAYIPVARFSSDVIDGCKPLSVKFKDESFVFKGNIDSWKWSLPKLLTSQNPVDVYNVAGKYPIRLVIETNLGCKDTLLRSDYIEVFENPSIEFTYTPDTPSYLFPDILIEDKSPSVLVQWYWEVNNTPLSDQQNIAFTFPDTGNYSITLIGKDSNLCENKANKEIYIAPTITFYMPNAFVPNDNTRNDTIKPEGIFLGITDYSFSIYNRWGELLFLTNNPYAGWDGKVNNKFVQRGVYIYKIRYSDFEHTKWYDYIGDIHLIRN